MLNNYIGGFLSAKKEFPEVKEKVEAIIDKIKGMRMKIFSFVEPFVGTEKFIFHFKLSFRYKAIGLVVANLAILGRSLVIANEFLKKLDDFENELFELKEKHTEIERDADEIGAKIYNDYKPAMVPKLKSG